VSANVCMPCLYLLLCMGIVLRTCDVVDDGNI
jgi:hypothetical protein